MSMLDTGLDIMSNLTRNYGKKGQGQYQPSFIQLKSQGASAEHQAGVGAAALQSNWGYALGSDPLVAGNP